MDPRPTCKSQNHKTFRKKVHVNLNELGLGSRFSDVTLKTQATKEKN